MDSLEQFQLDCERVGAEIDVRVTSAYHTRSFYDRLDDEPPSIRKIAPTPILAAVAVAAAIRRRGPTSLLATLKQGLEFTTTQNDDPGSQTLASLLFTEYAPPETTIPNGAVFDNVATEPYTNRCLKAERDLSELFSRLRDPSIGHVPGSEKRKGFQVIVAGPENTPIMVRKPNLPSAIVVHPFSARRQIHLPGALVALKLHGEWGTSPVSWLKGLEQGGVVAAEEIAGLSLMRLTPWAYPPDHEVRTDFLLVDPLGIHPHTPAARAELLSTRIEQVPLLPGIQAVLQEAGIAIS